MIATSAVQALELETVVSDLVSRCETALGQSRARSLAPLEDEDDALYESARVAEWSSLIAAGRDVALSVPPTCSALLDALAKSGVELAGEEIAGIGKLLESATRALAFLDSLEAESLRSLAAPLPSIATIESIIRRTVDSDGRVLDSASPELAAIRARRRVAGERLDRAVEHFFDAHSELGERIATLREERTVVAVRSDLGSGKYGLVHGRSSSGATFFVEPFELVDLNNQVVVLRSEERAECERLLRALCGRLRSIHPELVLAAVVVGQLDFLRARARFGRAAGCCAVLPSGDGGIELVAARHPLLVLDCLRNGHSVERVVPLSIKLAPGETLVITGPNTGGKTVALKTVGLALLLYSAGVPVPARLARLPFLRSLHIDIGDPQDISQNLSTFSGHVKNVVRALSDLELPALVLLDELGAGTDPREGSALAIAVLERLRMAGATVLVTSHHEALKRYALSTDGVRAAAVEFDVVSLRPTFRLMVDRAGASNALVIAERLGMPAAVIEHSRRILAGEEGELERALARLDAVSRSTDAARLGAEQSQQALDEERAGLAAREQELSRRELELRSRESGIKSRLRAESESRLQAVLAELRREGTELLADLAVEADRRRLDQKLAVRLSESAVRAEQSTRAATKGHGAPGEEELSGLGSRAQPGDRVRVRGLGVSGTLVTIDGRRAEVDAGGKRLRVDADAIEPLGVREAAIDSRISLSIATRDDLAREINVLGMTVEDARSVVDKFLDDALLARLPEVRVIHGHGTGRLGAGLRAHLETHPAVRSLESVSQGGALRVVLDT